VVKPEKWAEVPPAGEGAEPAFAVEGDQELIPVRPSDAELRRLERQSGAPPGSASAGATAATSGDPAARADEAYRRRAWSEAATGYQAALQQSPGNAVWKARLGESLYNLGDTGGAQAPLADAARSGQSAANKWLGHIARDQGDASGAIGYYQLYLKSRPPDASAIQAEVDRLSGG
jgi:tetratricopeptide (TPR) repeat protein